MMEFVTKYINITSTFCNHEFKLCQLYSASINQNSQQKSMNFQKNTVFVNHIHPLGSSELSVKT